MLKTYTAKYTKIPSGYMGQLVEWPEVNTEGKTLEECRGLLQDALAEMIATYRQQKKEIPVGGALIEQLAVATKVMPIGNATGMTQAERDELGAWIRAGAKIK